MDTNRKTVNLSKTKPGDQNTDTPFSVLRNNIKITPETHQALKQAQKNINNKTSNKLLLAIYRGYFPESKSRRVRIFFTKTLFIFLFGAFGRSKEINNIFKNNTHPTGRAIDLVLYKKDKKGKWKRVWLLLPGIRMFTPKWCAQRRLNKYKKEHSLVVSAMKRIGFTQIGNVVEDAQMHFYYTN